MQSIFRLDPEALSRGLFTLCGARQGAHTVLNVNYLPDLLHFVKQRLTSEQILRLEDYYLQNYLVELSINYGGKADLSSLVEEILKHIRENNRFWYRHNNQQVIDEQQQQKHTAIHQYQKDLTVLREDFKEEQSLMDVFSIDYPRRTSSGYCFRILHSNTEPYFGTRHSLNHIAYIPTFIVNKYEQSLSSTGAQSQISSQVFKREQKLRLVQQCVIFLLSNKTAKQAPKFKEHKGSSEEEQKGEQEPSSSSEEPNEEQKSIIDEFLEYISKISVLPTFHNSHHMHSLTNNILQIAYKMLLLSENARTQTEAVAEKEEAQRGMLQVIELPEESRSVLADLSEKEFGEAQCDLLAKSFLKYWNSVLYSIAKELQQKQNKSEKGWLNSPQEIAAIKKSYHQMLVKPQFLELTNYKAHGTGVSWKEDDYLRFLKGLSEFMNIPTNNKKIATFMGEGIEPNHVKHVKGLYLTVMKDRMEAGECGGGKRGKCLSKTQFLERDIATFSMRYFEKSKKIRKRKLKRRRKNSLSDDFDDDGDSQY